MDYKKEKRKKEWAIGCAIFLGIALIAMILLLIGLISLLTTFYIYLILAIPVVFIAIYHFDDLIP